MFQKEVSDRIRALPGNKVYGITSVVTQAWYTIEQIMVVEPGSFIPPPKVRSAVIRLKRNTVEHLGCDEKRFFQLVKIFPGLEKGVPMPYAKQRAEEISVSDFVALVNAAS
jgi:16S rRNA (adenine1518-N6/adenine1519-N6)-dimethyltransferase